MFDWIFGGGGGGGGGDGSAQPSGPVTTISRGDGSLGGYFRMKQAGADAEARGETVQYAPWSSTRFGNAGPSQRPTGSQAPGPKIQLSQPQDLYGASMVEAQRVRMLAEEKRKKQMMLRMLMQQRSMPQGQMTGPQYGDPGLYGRG